ncbi:MAG: triose-phosphate isomerase [Alphaproteobacteria bacterium]|nr:triose-phosphate isomerase [Alphaproteobacteria bacterium]
MAKLIAGNWKMNGSVESSRALAGGLAEKVKATPGLADVAICPPGPLMRDVLTAVAGSPIGVGGQDCHWNEAGAHTGDTSAALLADIGCAYAIVGHSERRADHGETSEQVKAKAEAVLSAGLVAIVCVGETEAERDTGQTETVVGRQIDGSLPDGGTPKTVVIAYEPVWAIGTGRTPSLEEIAAVHAFIRARAQESYDLGEGLRLLYGGSVKPGNAAEILAVEGVDGALVGGASLTVEDFWGIIESCP